MSLIEQAARRLEQLREAGSQLSGDLEFPEKGSAVRRPDEESSMIEPPARQRRGLGHRRAGLEAVPGRAGPLGLRLVEGRKVSHQAAPPRPARGRDPRGADAKP